MKSILFAAAALLASTAAQAEVWCDQQGCREIGKRIILVDPSYVRGQDFTSHRGPKPQRMRNNGKLAEDYR